MPSPTIISPNGAGSVVASLTNSIGTTLNLTTVAKGDILILAFAIDGAQQPGTVLCNGAAMVALLQFSDGDPTVDGVTGAVWAGEIQVSGTGLQFEVIYPLGFDDCGLFFSIHRGCDLVRAFDPTPVLPSLSVGNPPTTPVIYSTKNADDQIMFYAFGHSGLWLTPELAEMPPWTVAGQFGNSGGAGFIGGAFFQNTVSAPQVAQTITPAIALYGSTALITLALTADPSVTDTSANPLPIATPPPYPMPCVAPCQWALNPGSHAFGMFYGSK